MPKKRSAGFPSRGKSTKYCEKHERYYPAAIGCQLCAYDTYVKSIQAEGKSQQAPEVSQRVKASDVKIYQTTEQLLLELMQTRQRIDELERVAVQRRQTEEELKQSLANIRRILDNTINVVATIVEMREPYAAGHQQRVALLACAIAAKMSLPDEKIDNLHTAALLHDTGKIYVPTETLGKPEKLTETERAMVNLHSQMGFKIVQKVDFPRPVAQIVLQHHERLDGSGYPYGISGDEILPEARILAVADVIEAMASARPHRPALGIDIALKEISKNKGTLYDPKVVDACVELFTEHGFTLN